MHGNKYVVTITFPADLSTQFGQVYSSVVSTNNPNVLNLSSALSVVSDRCIQAAYPGQALKTSDANRHGMGIREKMPVGALFNDIPMTFIADNIAGDTTHTFFKTWMDFIHPVGITPTQVPYTMEYKDNYAATVQINKYALDGALISNVYLFRAYPVAINDAPVSWMDTNKLLTYSLVMTYASWGFNSNAQV